MTTPLGGRGRERRKGTGKESEVQNDGQMEDEKCAEWQKQSLVEESVGTMSDDPVDELMARVSARRQESRMMVCDHPSAAFRFSGPDVLLLCEVSCVLSDRCIEFHEPISCGTSRRCLCIMLE